MVSTHLILASASPRRQDLLKLLPYEFAVLPADIDETQHEHERPIDYVTRLALEKARKIAVLHPDSYVIGADTIVVLDNLVLGKPKDEEDAQKILSQLSGLIHQVISSYAVVSEARNFLIQKTVITEVEFNLITEKDIVDYVATKEPMDKAGAYALQGIAAKFIRRINGSHTNVIGLDIASLKIDLEKILSNES